MKLEDEIKTTFLDEYHKLVVNVIYTQNYVSQCMSKILKSHGLTTQQYNLLRILRGQHPKPANINLLIDRMLDKMSNASRLVDKLVQKGLVVKKRNAMDRRNADVSISQKGLDLLAKVDPETNQFSQSFDNLSPAEAKKLNDLLDKMRDRQ